MSSVQSLDRAFALLEAVATKPTGLTDLARSTDLALSTVSRLLGSLEELGAVVRDGSSGLYSIGLGIAELAASIDSGANLTARVRTYLHALTDEMGETTGMSVPTGYEMHYIFEANANQPVQVKNWEGTRIAMHLVSAGLVTLATWPPDAVDNYLDRTLDAPMPASVSHPDQLRVLLDEVREDGFAWTSETLVAGLTSIAAPLVNNNGELVAAIHIQGPAYRFPGAKQDEITDALLKTAAEISATLVS